MKSLIDTNTLHSGMAKRRFRYAEMLNIKLPLSDQKPIHQIMCKLVGRGHKWQLLAKDGEPLIYTSAEAAKADVKKLNDWAKSHKVNNHI